MAWDEDDELPELSPQYALFVTEYLKELNGARAAMACGYSQNEKSAATHASRLLKNVDINRHIQAELTRRRLRSEINADWFVKRLAKIIDFDPEEVVEITDDGSIKLNPKAPPGSLKYFDTISSSVSSSSGETNSDSQSLSIKNKDKLKAMDLLSKVLGITHDPRKPDFPNRTALDRRVSDSLQKRKGRR